MIKQSLLLALTLMFASCATPTPYQPDKQGVWATPPLGGYTDEKIDDHLYWVEFLPNGLTSKEATEDYTLLRAAELTLEKGYDRFEIIEWQKGPVPTYFPPRIDEPAITIIYNKSRMKIRLLDPSSGAHGDVRNARDVAKAIRAKPGFVAR
ncbi:MAG TPA: hypothetical protein VNV15_01930 [Opitutaceae bacterium]|jgi:hypothetical protein|nr:hypothetical protein [Opitutaceae bacterium]